jgi:hypothetical protein
VSSRTLIDRGRQIHCYAHWPDIETRIGEAVRNFRLDRTEGQDVSIYLGVEKAGMVVQLQSWFGDLGIPIRALGGYSSQTYVDDVANDAMSDGRPAVLLYAGDFDPSGEDIDRHFVKRTDCWAKIVPVALTATQIREYSLPINPGKSTDSRAAGFISRHGELMQIELDALDPDELPRLYADAIAEYWDESVYLDAVQRERQQRESA